MLFLHFYDSYRLKYLSALILVFSLFSCSSGGEVSKPFAIGVGEPNSIADGGPAAISALGLNWVAPSEREDGTGLALSEIAGYRIYYGTTAGVYQNQIDINDHTAEQAQIAYIPVGRYYVVMTTIDTEGRESAYSSEVVVTV
jgi:hypothetical protein